MKDLDLTVDRLKINKTLRNKLKRAGVTDLRQCFGRDVTPATFLLRQCRARAGVRSDGEARGQDRIGPEGLIQLFDALMDCVALALPIAFDEGKAFQKTNGLEFGLERDGNISASEGCNPGCNPVQKSNALEGPSASPRSHSSNVVEFRVRQ